MRQRDRQHRNMLLLSGWLFANLLLVLVVVFVVSNVFDINNLHSQTARPTPTPTALPRLELNKHRFTIQVDPDGLLNDSPTAINRVERLVESQTFL